MLFILEILFMICQWNKGPYLLLHYMYGIMNLKMYIVPKTWYPRILILQSNKSIFQFIIGKVHCTFRFKILLSQLFQFFFTHWSRTMFFILFYYHLDIFIYCSDTFFPTFFIRKCFSDAHRKLFLNIWLKGNK